MSDLIKRSDAIKVLKDSVVEMGGGDFCEMGVHIDDIEAVVNAIPSADRPQEKWIIHYRDKWMVRAECPKCHRRFEFSPRAIWKCCPMCETRMKGADDETAND